MTRMSRAERRAATASARSAERPVLDGFQNVSARLGHGTDNIASGAKYAPNPVSRNRVQLEWMYRGSWIVGQAVDSVAEDMTRAGVAIKATSDPSEIEVIQAALARMRVGHRLCDTVKWARLYGGAIAVHLVEGQDLSKPLRPETVGRGQYHGLLDLDRWAVTPSDAKVKEFGPDLGFPEFYDVMSNAPALNGQRVHHSRVIRIDGEPLPHQQRLAENGWGLSVVERLFDRLTAFDSTTLGAAQLVYKAHLRTVGVESLRDILAAGGAAEEALIKMFEMIRVMQSNEGLSLIDAKDKFETHSYTFSGLSDVLMQFAQQISGALQIPLVRLFGQSPAGLNSTGESDIRMYYDRIDQQREDKLRAGMGVVLDLTHRSEVGTEPPQGFGFDFAPLWQMSDREKAEIAAGITGAVVQAVEAGVVTQATGLKELRQSADVTGVWSNIPDAEIEEAEANPPGPEVGGDDGSPDPLGVRAGLAPSGQGKPTEVEA